MTKRRDKRPIYKNPLLWSLVTGVISFKYFKHFNDKLIEENRKLKEENYNLKFTKDILFDSREDIPFKFLTNNIISYKNKKTTIKVLGDPGETYTIEITSPSGSLLTATGLEEKKANDKGLVEWSYIVDPRTRIGKGKITVTNSKQNSKNIPYYVKEL